ncbi:MAG: hypothetical protein F4W90_03165 [Gammaproteobacteria bacterium]|nr:hypothetical protein [Gammaproteobacteria bacterium]
MSDYRSLFSNESVACRHVADVLSFELLGPNLTYASLDAIAQAANASRNDASVRALGITISANSTAPEAMGELPERFAHRQPRGSQGVGPLVEQETIRALRAFMKPTIAFLHGDVCDVGIDIAAVCDLRVASTNLALQDTRILQGRTASTGIAYLLPKLIGQSQAMRVLLLGDKLTATETLRINFVHEVVEDAEFDEFRAIYAERIARMATRAWEVHKLQVLGQQHLDFESAMTHSLGIRQTHVIHDRVEGIKAWRERREPEFKGI